MRGLLNARLWIVAVLFGVAAGMPFFTTEKDRRDLYFFDVTLTSSSSGTTQLFWDFGNGTSEINSSLQPLKQEKTPVLYRFMLPAGTLRGFRFNVTDRKGTDMTLTKAQIVDRHQHVIRAFAPAEFSVGQEIDHFKVQDETVSFATTPDAHEPFLNLKFTPPVTLTYKFGPQLTHALPVGVGAFAIALLVGVVFSTNGIQRRFSSIGTWAAAHPTSAILLTATVAVVIQCHPVLFLGRSFASPNNGSLMLYADLPTLPGSTQNYYEDGMGSDVGALLFQHLYYPMVEHRAIFRNHELPLWNRYSLAGLPLLGQGMSMFGNPFHFVTLLANGAAWAWDFNFVLAHWLLAVGIGLTAWRLTRHLAASLLVAGGATFVSFFMFRINHPATFAVCYAPWLVWAWVGLIQTTSLRGVAKWLPVLILANWTVMTSGTIKEAYMTMLCLNISGVVLLFVLGEAKGKRIILLSLTTLAGIVFCLLSAPLWMSFLVALSRSETSYDIPRADALNIRQVIGFFDDIFYRQNWSDERALAPSLNFLFLVGLLWWLASPRLWFKERAGLALFLSSLLPFSIAFGIVPSSVITSIPFVANVIHVGNTFSCPLMITVALLAACGLKHCWDHSGERRWWIEYGVASLLGVFVCGIFFFMMKDVTMSSFFQGYWVALAIASFLLPVSIGWIRSRQNTGLGYTALLICLVLLLWRHGQYQKTPFDRYVFNPGERLDFRAPSDAVEFLNAHRHGPERVVGWGYTLFPAYNTALGWEGLYGVDAVRNRYYHEFAASGNLDRVWKWDMETDEKKAETLVPYQDVLNVAHYIATHKEGTHEITNVRLLGQFDLDVYESPTVWPRAFFTDRIFKYTKPNQLARRILVPEHPPFAALQTTQNDIPSGIVSLLRVNTSNTAVPAYDYKLTNNGTYFTVDAPGPGIAVLTETYYPKDFQVRVNGAPADYFRVNHAFKGVYVPGAGKYRIEFTYWPEHFSLALGLGGIGFVLLLAGVWLIPRFIPPRFFPQSVDPVAI